MSVPEPARRTVRARRRRTTGEPSPAAQLRGARRVERHQRSAAHRPDGVTGAVIGGTSVLVLGRDAHVAFSAGSGVTRSIAVDHRRRDEP